MTEIFEIPTENFSLANANDLYNNGSRRGDECKEYIEKYAYPLENGDHALIKDGEFIIKAHDKFVRTYLNRLPKDIKKWYMEERTVYDYVLKPHKPKVYGNNINHYPTFKHKKKAFKEHSEKAQKGVAKMLEFYKDIWASGNEAMFQYLIKWFAVVAKCGKNDSHLYLKSIKGVGKSTGTNFFLYNVIGNKACIESDGSPLYDKFNFEIFGKVVVLFEELQRANPNGWTNMHNELLRYATSPTLVFQQKFMEKIIAQNITNTMICTNSKALQDPDGRRIAVLDIATHKFGDKNYWDEMNSYINDEVGSAFFNYLLEIDTSAFSAQYDMPETDAKNEAIADKLDRDDFIRFD